MNKNRSVQVRFTQLQHQQLVQNSRQYGFRTIADFVRHKTLNDGLKNDQRLKDIHAYLLGEEVKLRSRRP